MGNFYAYFTAFSAALGGLLFGYEIGIISTVMQMESFNVFFNIKLLGNKLADGTQEVLFAGNPAAGEIHDKSLVNGDIAMWFLLGCMLGAIIVGFLADKIGRRRSIFIGSFLFTLGSIIQTATPSLVVLYIGRFIGGAGVGILSNAVPLYISETAPTNIRGTVIAVQQLMITIGILLANIVNAIIWNAIAKESDVMWRLALGLQAVPGVILFFSMFFLPYSPRWLANNDRNDEALATLAKMRRMATTDPALQEEYNSIIASVQTERQIGSASWGELLLPGIRNRVVIGIILQFFQQFTGINVIMYFAGSLFLNMGFSIDTAATVAGTINSAVNVIATFPGMYLVDRLGRRKLLISGGINMGIAMALVTVFSKLAAFNPSVPAYAYLGAVGIYMFVASFAYSWGPIVWVYQSEIFPLRIRGKGTAVATFTNWACNAIVGKVAPILMEENVLGAYTYLIFAGLGFLMASFTYFFLPETKGYSLEEMDEIFDPEGAGRRAQKVNEKV